MSYLGYLIQVGFSYSRIFWISSVWILYNWKLIIHVYKISSSKKIHNFVPKFFSIFRILHLLTYNDVLCLQRMILLPMLMSNCRLKNYFYKPFRLYKEHSAEDDPWTMIKICFRHYEEKDFYFTVGNQLRLKRGKFGEALIAKGALGR